MGTLDNVLDSIERAYQRLNVLEERQRNAAAAPRQQRPAAPVLRADAQVGPGEIASLRTAQLAGRLDSKPLTRVIETDPTGRRISRFYGNPEGCWGPFKDPTIRAVSGFATGRR